MLQKDFTIFNAKIYSFFLSLKRCFLKICSHFFDRKIFSGEHEKFSSISQTNVIFNAKVTGRLPVALFKEKKLIFLWQGKRAQVMML